MSERRKPKQWDGETQKLPSEFQWHHTQYYRTLHNAMSSLKRIRHDKRLIAPIHEDPHVDAHKAVVMVPPMPHHLAVSVERLFNQMPDMHNPAENVENYMRAIEEALKNPRHDEITRAQGNLAILANEMQLPYLREGWIGSEKYADDWILNAA